MNEIQLTNQLGQFKPSKKKNDTKTASSNNLSNGEAVMNMACIFKFNLDREKKIHFIGNSDVKHGGLPLWRYASIRNNKLSLRLELIILDSSTGPLTNKLLIKLELLNKRNHQLSNVKLKETYYWKNIISIEELENPSLGFVDDQGVFTFQLVVLHVTNK
ncbi:hypothetical protein SNE40_006789 [Patella caerulea]|uniref:Uncharacterized protein n=1 Tax=Patella caerulea TaxID=87958 RepID=A0AAN8PWI8_PATCE